MVLARPRGVLGALVHLPQQWRAMVLLWMGRHAGRDRLSSKHLVDDLDPV